MKSKRSKLRVNNQSFRDKFIKLYNKYGDTLHQIDVDFGYPETVTFENMYNMYRRFGIAANAINLYPEICWSTNPEITGSEEFNKKIKYISEKTNMYTRMKGLDIRQRVGRYGGMFMRVRDGKKPSEPIDGFLNDSALLEMMPLYESQLKVVKVDSDINSDRYGQPILYQLSGSATGDKNNDVSDTITIHHSRVVIAAEGADNGWIYGIPALESVYNSLMDLRKILGSGGEGFYKNASQNVIFKLLDADSAIINSEILDKFNENYDNFSADRMRRAMWTPGMDAEVLQSMLSDPKNYFMNSLNDVAAGLRTPATILIGQQTGRLASSEDSRTFLYNGQSRRVTFLTGLVESIVDWLVKYKILPASDYTVVWDDLLARSAAENLDNAAKMAVINEKSFNSGNEQVYSAQEIREMSGYISDEMPEPSEEIEETEETEEDEQE